MQIFPFLATVAAEFFDQKTIQKTLENQYVCRFPRFWPPSRQNFFDHKPSNNHGKSTVLQIFPFLATVATELLRPKTMKQP